MTEDYLDYLPLIVLKIPSVLSGMSNEVMYPFENKNKQRNSGFHCLKSTSYPQLQEKISIKNFSQNKTEPRTEFI